MKCVISWTGGKDCALAYDIAKNQGHEVIALLTIILNKHDKRIGPHRPQIKLIKAQAEAMNIDVITIDTDSQYEKKEYINKLKYLKEKEGIEGCIFGCIDYNGEAKEWIEEVCLKANIKPIISLKGKTNKEILDLFFTRNIKAIILSCKNSIFKDSILGLQINKSFISNINKKTNIDNCGEIGEYHSFVINGPFFNKSINIIKTTKEFDDEYWHLNILDYKLEKNKLLY